MMPTMQEIDNWRTALAPLAPEYQLYVNQLWQAARRGVETDQTIAIWQVEIRDRNETIASLKVELAALKAAQPQEYPSSADDEATRWRHGEPTQPERVSVPREPTPEMWDAAWNSIGLPYRAKLSMHEIKTLFDKFHSAMLAAAPKETK